MKELKIRRAWITDKFSIQILLRQVLEVHHNGRPDLFKPNAQKYSSKELSTIILDDSRPVFVAVDSENTVVGYAFCQFIQHRNHNILTNIKTLYIDDLCVDENLRGQHIGKMLFDHVLVFAKENGCYNLTLNVWTCNPSAMAFYEKCGLVPQKVGMEMLLTQSDNTSS